MVEGQTNQALASCCGDADCDGVVDGADNCPQYFNSAQEDSDAPALSRGMAGGFSFEEVPGSFVIKDSTGNSDGTSVNTGILRKGRFGQGMNFQSIQGRGYIRVPNNPALQSVSGTAMTLAAWVRPRDDNGNAIMGKSGQFQFMWGGPETRRALAFFGAGPFVQTTIAVTMPNNVWSHVALTYDGEALRFYVNGELVDSKAESRSVPIRIAAILS